jgi:hypothetical protein
LAAVGLNAALVSLLAVPNQREHWSIEMSVHQRHSVVTGFFDKVVIRPRGKAANAMKVGDVEFWVPDVPEPMLYASESNSTSAGLVSIMVMRPPLFRARIPRRRSR